MKKVVDGLRLVVAMKVNLKCLSREFVIGSVLALVFSASASALTITDGTVSANVNPSGTFASLTYTGTEFVNWSIPMSYYSLGIGGTTWTANNAPGSPGSNPFGAFTITPIGTNSLTFTAAPTGGLSFQESIQMVGSSALVTVSLSNLTNHAINGVEWAAGMDPDQGVPMAGTYATTNTILAQGTGASVIASATGTSFYHDAGVTKSVTLRQSTGSGGSGKVYIGTACCSALAPSYILAHGQAAGFTTGSADDSINIGYNIGTIAKGTSVSIAYEYDFATIKPIPEPETYAMLLAGLSLMGIVARRRKRTVI